MHAHHGDEADTCLPVPRVDDEFGDGLQGLYADHVITVAESRQQHLRLQR